ncbi:hypothetical protein Tco_1280250, partial [Tanacetum coccineum]
MWAVLEKIFTDNKRSKIVELIGSNTTEDELVTYAINGLNDKYEHVAHVILNKDPFPNLEQARSILSLAESRINKKSAFSASNNSRGTGSLNNNHSNGYGTRNFHNNHSNGYGTRQGSAQINPTTLGHDPLLEAYTQLLQTHQRLLSQSFQQRGTQAQQVKPINNRGPGSSIHQQLQAHVDTHETTSPQAFSTLTLQDFGDAGWNMDT